MSSVDPSAEFLSTEQFAQLGGLHARRYLNIEELSAQTGLSLASIHRLKKQGKIPFYQPAGKGGKLLFPPDAIERAAGTESPSVKESDPVATTEDSPRPRLSGPCPAWMKSTNIPLPMSPNYAP